MASVPDTSHLPWWLGPHRPASEALLQGAQAGAVIMSNFFKGKQLRAELEQNVQREQTVTALKLMDLQLDKERNQITLKNHLFKQKADIAQAEGTASLMEFAGNAYRDGKITDQQTLADFYNLAASKFVPSDVVKSIADSTFKPAMERQAMARAPYSGSGVATSIQETRYLKNLEEQAKWFDDHGFTDDANELKSQAESFKMKSGLSTTSSSEINVAPDGTKLLIVRAPGARSSKIITLPDDTKFMSSFALDWFNARVRQAAFGYEKLEDRFLTNGDRDPKKLEAEIDSLSKEAVEMGRRKAPGEAAPKEGPSASPTKEDFEGWLKKKGLQVPK